MEKLSRRQWVAGATAATIATRCTQRGGWAVDTSQPGVKQVAAVVTAYEAKLHADVLLGKILEGWKQDGGPGPRLSLASMYVDQFGSGDMAKSLSKKYNVPIFDSIEKAVTVGGNQIPVDGVISIGEHGRYPSNAIGQHLYPRRRFFAEITAAFEKYDRVVPVFSDKHLGPQWTDAIWMYRRAKQLSVPFMAGSSLPVSYRKPRLDIPLGDELQSAIGVGYSGLDIYGSHTLDCYQCIVERRRNAENGVRSVQYLEGAAMWKAVDAHADPEVLEAVLKALPKQEGGTRKSPGSSLFLFEYVDGFRGLVLMLPKYVAGIGIAVKRKSGQVLATRFEERVEPNHPHFAYLLKAVEQMMHTGKPSYPVERTLLTSGVLDRALRSRASGQKRLATPELGIAYQPVDYPYAPDPPLVDAD